MILRKIWMHMHRDGAPAWWVSFSLVVVLALVGYGFILQPGQIVYSPHSDILAYHLGAKEVLWRSLEAGQGIPFWRSDQLSGGPAFTGPNALYTYPLHFLFYLWRPLAAVGWTIFLHLIVGAGACYALGRSLQLGRRACLLMAVAGLFNFKMLMVVYAGWLSVLPSITLLPALFAAVFWLAANPGRTRMLTAAAVGALCLHAGQLQLVYYAFWFLLVYVILRIVGEWRAGDGRAAWLSARRFCYSGLLACGLTAYLLISIIADIRLITRSVASEEFFHSGRTVQFQHLLTFFNPEALGTLLDGSYAAVEMWEGVAYFGLIPLSLAFVGVIAGWKRLENRFLFGSFVASAIFALDTPLLHVPYLLLPGFSLFRLPGRLLFLSAFFGIALAGIGVDAVFERMRARGVGTWQPTLLASVLLCAMAAEGVLHARQYLDTIDQSRAVPVTEYDAFLSTDRDLFRIAPVGRNTVSYGWAAPMGLQMIAGYEPYNLRVYQRYMSLLRTGRDRYEDAVVSTDVTQVARWDLVDALNVKYLLAPTALPLPAHRFDLVAQFYDQPVFVFYEGMQRVNVFLYRNNNVLPRVRWAGEVVGVQDEDEALAAMHRNDLHDVSVVQDAGAATTEARLSRGSPDDQAVVLSSADGHLTVETESRARRFLVISEVWHPGWIATLDSQNLPLLRTNFALMGAWIPPGKHRLALRFQPLYWRMGVAISILSAAIFLICEFWAFRYASDDNRS